MSCQAPNKILKTQVKTIKIFAFLICVFGFWFLNFDFAFAGWTSGKFGSAINFDGVNDYVNSNGSLAAASAFSYSLWFKSSDGSFAADEYLFSQGTNDPSVYLESTDNKVKVMADGADKLSSVKTVNNTEWRHLEITADGATIKLYLDGVLESSAGYTGSSAAGILYAASSATPGSYFGGIIDDVRVYNYARTQDEILADYNSGKAAHLGKDSQRDDGLVGYWNMEEGTGQTISDRSGNGNNGTLGANSSVGKDDPVFTTGYSSSGPGGTGLKFDGVDDYVGIPYSQNLDFSGETNITITAWVKTQSDGGEQYIVGSLNDETGTNKASFILDNWGTKGLRVFNIPTSSTYITSEWTYNQWYFVAITYNGSQRIWYIDGNAKQTNEVTGPIPVGNDGGSGARIGTGFTGSIDDVRVYNRALSADEIRQLYNQKKPVLEWKFDEGSGQIAYDGSFNNNDGTLGSTSGSDANDPAWTTGKFGSALSFDGTSDYVDTSTINFVGTQFTFTFWMNMTNVSNTGIPLSWSGDRWCRIGGLTANKINCSVDSSSAGSSVSTTSINDGKWHYIAYQVISNSQKLFIDGAQEGFATETLDTVNGIVRIGNVSVGGYPYNGLVDDVRIYNYARTQDEILADYNSGKAAHLGKDSQRDDGLVGYWNMEEGTGQTISDRSGSGNNGTLGASTSVGKDDPVFTAGYSSAGPSGTALQFDGKDDYVDIDSIRNTVSGPSSFSVWIKTSSSANMAIVGELSTWSNSYGFGLGIVNKQVYGIAANDNANWYINLISGVLSSDWNHVVLTFNSWGANTTGKLYVNGQEVKTYTSTASKWSDYRFLIGEAKIISDSSQGRRFNGLIDEVRIYNRALSADEIRYLYNQKKPILEMKFDEGSGQIAYDGSFNNNDGTLGDGTCVAGAGTCPSWATGKFGSALQFDGGDDYVLRNNPVGMPTSDFTISAWVNTTSTSTYRNIFGHNTYVPGFYVHSGKLNLYWNGDHLSNGTVNDGMWHYATVARTGTTLYFYIDGKYDATSTASLSWPTSTSFRIGYSGYGTEYFNGLIDNVRIYSYARTQDEILADYNNGLAAHLR